jgi:uncharacterized damage-inducible protein DinB
MDFQKELIAEYDREAARTRKILEAIPADADFAWKPHPKSMTLGRLAGHLSESAGEWAVTTLTTDKLIFAEGHKFEGYVPESKEALLVKFDQQVTDTKKALVSFAPEQWDENWKMGMGEQIWIDEPKYEVWRSWVLNHMIHHRAQLGVYIRLLDKPLPGTYGPSADDR